MAGSIRKRGRSSFEIQITLGRDQLTGKKLRIYRTVRGTRKDAERVLRSMLCDIDNGLAVNPSSITVGDYLVDWLESNKSRISPTTYGSYESILKNHLLPTIGPIPLQKLAPLAIQNLYTSKLEPSRDRSGLSPGTVTCIHRVLHKALRQAVKLQLIPRNPCDAVEPPRQQRKEPGYWTADQARRFLDSIRGDRLYALFYLAINTGLRRGELLGLRWESVDLVRGELTVRESLVRTSNGVVNKGPKTARSRRTIAISGQTIDVLKSHRTEQAKERLLAGDAYQDNHLVFAGSTGKPLNPDYISVGYFRRLVQQARVPRICFHGLRHTHATILGSMGVPLKTVSHRLGHSSVSVTGDIYSHVFGQMDRDAADAIEEALDEARRGTK